jgi:hypothetical protein
MARLVSDKSTRMQLNHMLTFYKKIIIRAGRCKNDFGFYCLERCKFLDSVFDDFLIYTNSSRMPCLVVCACMQACVCVWVCVFTCCMRTCVFDI